MSTTMKHVHPSGVIDGALTINALGDKLLTPAQRKERDKLKELGPRNTLGPRLSGALGTPPAAARAGARRTLGVPERVVSVNEMEATLRANPTLFDTVMRTEFERVPRARKSALQILLEIEKARPAPRAEVLVLLNEAIEKPPENTPRAPVDPLAVVPPVGGPPVAPIPIGPVMK